MEWWEEREAFWKMTDSEGEGAAERERLAAEAFAGWQRRKAEDEKADQERGSDFLALQAAEFRDYWIATRSRYYGSFEDISEFTNHDLLSFLKLPRLVLLASLLAICFYLGWVKLSTIQ